MCPSRPTGRTQAAPSRSQATLDIWSQIQNRRRRNIRRGYFSETYNDHPIQNNIIQQPTKYSKDTQCYGDIPTPIDETSIWRIIGGNVNGIKLQVGTIVFSETNVEWHKFLLRDNAQSLLQKAFVSARVEYSTSSSKFETKHNKPGGTLCAALGSWVHRVIGSGKDNTGCGRWSYTTYAAKDDMKVSVVSCYRVCNQTNPGSTTASNQQHGIMYADEELRPFMMNPHHQTMIDIQYFVQNLQEKGHEIIVMIDTNQSEGQYYQSQLHNGKIRTAQGFHVDGSIDRSIQTFISKCGLDNAITLMHDGLVPNTHMRGSSHIDFPLTSAVLREYIKKVGILDNLVLHSDHRGMFLDLNARLFGKSPEKVIPHQFRTLKLDDPRLSDAYRRILHKQFEEHNVFGRVQAIAGRGKSSEWTLTDEEDYKKLDLDISQVMKHASRMCSLRKKHNTPWAKSLSTATHAIRYCST
jgi:hypothetical protein